jgi:hypothetical protein
VTRYAYSAGTRRTDPDDRLGSFATELAGSNSRDVRCAAEAEANSAGTLRQVLERADLVSAHEAAVALHIRCEDSDEASADLHGRHKSLLPRSSALGHPGQTHPLRYAFDPGQIGWIGQSARTYVINEAADGE